MPGFGWSYPPGVTGNEDYFGPRREYADDRECDAKDVTLYCRSAADGETTVEVTVDTCPWAGKADVSEWNGGRTTWMCPACGTEHEDEPDEPDWDAIADAIRDDEIDRADDLWRDR